MQRIGNSITIFHSSRPTNVRVRTCPKAFGNSGPQLQNGLCSYVRQSLGIRIGTNKINTVYVIFDHVSNGITATATNTDHLYNRALRCVID